MNKSSRSAMPLPTTPNVILMSELKVLKEAVKVALSDLIAAEEQFMIEEMAKAKRLKAANVFIDRTIASVLVDNDDNAYAPNNGESLVVELLGTAIAAPAVARAPPIWNKKARKDHYSESATPLSCSTSTLTSTSTTSARDGVGRIIPQMVDSYYSCCCRKCPYRGIGNATGG